MWLKGCAWPPMFDRDSGMHDWSCHRHRCDLTDESGPPAPMPVVEEALSRWAGAGGGRAEGLGSGEGGGVHARHVCVCALGWVVATQSDGHGSWAGDRVPR